MVNIILTNRITNAKYKKANIDINKRICILDDVKEIKLQQLTTEKDFQHPILLKEKINPKELAFVYKYNNTHELLNAATYVYSVLLNTDKPEACTFKITPSVDYKNAKTDGVINFSINPAQSSPTKITLKQLNAIMTDLRGYKFEYRDNIEIDAELTLHDLPASVDGDNLFINNPDIIKLIDTPVKLDNYELRYIDPRIGCGLFARTYIKKDENLFVYGGIKKTEITYSDYCFSSYEDALNTSVDARDYGNITRFVNHAFDNVIINSGALRSNVTAKPFYLNGLVFIIYVALRNINPGEQLLVDYGTGYFSVRKEFKFKANGKVMDKSTFLPLKNTEKKVGHLQIIANHGVKEAQNYIFMRIVTASFAIIIMLIIARLCI